MRFVIALLMTMLFADIGFAQSCRELKIERNAVYKRAGYCFHTQDMIRVFGNAGCMYDTEAEVPLSDDGRDEVAEIARMEREAGCR